MNSTSACSQWATTRSRRTATLSSGGWNEHCCTQLPSIPVSESPLRAVSTYRPLGTRPRADAICCRSDSVMTLARDNGMRVVERPFAFDEWVEDFHAGRLTEAFACGTAAVVTPIGRVGWEGGELAMAAGEVTAGLRAQLVDIQRGRTSDPYGWTHKVW